MQRLLSFAETRARLGNRSRSAIYVDLEAKRIPAPLKIGGKLYWSEADLEAWIAEQAQRARASSDSQAEGAK